MLKLRRSKVRFYIHRRVFKTKTLLILLLTLCMFLNTETPTIFSNIHYNQNSENSIISNLTASKAESKSNTHTSCSNNEHCCKHNINRIFIPDFVALFGFNHNKENFYQITVISNKFISNLLRPPII